MVLNVPCVALEDVERFQDENQFIIRCTKWNEFPVDDWGISQVCPNHFRIALFIACSTTWNETKKKTVVSINPNMYNKYLYMCVCCVLCQHSVLLLTYYMHCFSSRFVSSFTLEHRISLFVCFFSVRFAVIFHRTLLHRSQRIRIFIGIFVAVLVVVMHLCVAVVATAFEYFVLFLVIDFHASSAIKDAMSKRMHCGAAYALLLFTFFL